MIALSIVPLWAFGVQFAFATLAVTTPRGAWTAVLLYSLLAVLAFACSIPLRPAPHLESGPAGSATAQSPQKRMPRRAHHTEETVTVLSRRSP